MLRVFSVNQVSWEMCHMNSSILKRRRYNLLNRRFYNDSTFTLGNYSHLAKETIVILNRLTFKGSRVHIFTFEDSCNVQVPNYHSIINSHFKTKETLKSIRFAHF